MAKKVSGYIKLQIPAGQANPAPPVGPALGQHGVNIMEFCKQYNAVTKDQAGLVIPVVITVYQDKSFTFVTKSPPAAVLLKKAAKIAAGSGEPNKKKVGKVTKKQLLEIVETKKADLNARDPEMAARMIAGTARLWGSRLWNNLKNSGRVERPVSTAPRKMPKKTSKRFSKALEMVEPGKSYSVAEAAELLGKFPKAKFDESIEIAFKMTIDPRKTDQMIRGTVRLPHGSGKEVKVLVFAKEGEAATAAKDAGAEFVGFEEYIEKVTSGWTGFDVAVATPEAMAEVRKLGRVLGPRGLMPNPKTGTVTDDTAKAVQEVKAGRVEYKLDKGANIQVLAGKVSFSADQIADNANTIIDEIIKAKPSAAKGRYIENCVLSSTMSPGIPLDLKGILKAA